MSIGEFLQKKYGEGTQTTVYFREFYISGIMYGNDECFDGDNFYQYLVSRDEKGHEHCYKCYYTANVPLDEIDYTRSYYIEDATEVAENL